MPSAYTASLDHCLLASSREAAEITSFLRQKSRSQVLRAFISHCDLSRTEEKKKQSRSYSAFRFAVSSDGKSPAYTLGFSVSKRDQLSFLRKGRRGRTIVSPSGIPSGRGMASLRERFNLPFSSTPRNLTVISSPTAQTSSTFSTRL